MSPDLIKQINSNARHLLELNRTEFDALGIETKSLSNGAEVFDFGKTSTAAAGQLLARICMADLADINLLPKQPVVVAGCYDWVGVQTKHPLVSCMAAQYAGWPLSVDKYFAMCSGPARSARGKEAVLEEYQLIAVADSVVAVLETGKLPDESVAEAIANECNVAPDRVQLCVAPTSSVAGAIQIVARSVETAIHKLHELKFDLSVIKAGRGSAPLPPPAKDDLVALGWTNDSILYGAEVDLTVECEDAVLEEIGPKVPASSSSDFGTPFLEIFERFDRDFYRIDKMLFSPARIAFKNMRTGNRFGFGKQRWDILSESWCVSSDD